MTAKHPTASKPRLVGLDLLRLVAIVLVLGRHVPAVPESASGKLLFLTWYRGGWVGVDLFFVLSGFLVSGLLFTEYKSRGRLGVGRFYLRRGWKIYPPFFVLITASVLMRLREGWPIPLESLAAELFFLQSYMPGLWNHTWSLAVEEHFYLLLPLTLALVLHWNRHSPTPLRPILSLAAGVAAFALASRLLNWYLRPSYNNFTHLFASHLRLDSLFFGVAIAYAYHFHSSTFDRLFTRPRRFLIVAGALLLIPAFVFPLETTPFIYTIGLTIFYVGSGMMLVGILLCQIPHGRLLAVLATLGAYSYSIYLWHMFVVFWGMPLVEGTFDLELDAGSRIAMYFAGSFGLGIAMAKVVEVPTLRMRDRWFPSRSPGPLGEKPNQALNLALPTQFN
jgi:peptidoglycan/LPS O-acetylase OafA/YrhL